MELAMNNGRRAALLGSAAAIARSAVSALENWLAPLLDLGLRLWVAGVFFQSGMVKIQSWETTLLLFEYEYQTPFLPPLPAAYLGTAAELALPVFLVLGLGGRLAAAALFAVNIVAVLSYPGLSEIGLEHHQYWGLMLLVTLLHGPGKLSVDHLLRKRFF